MSSQPEGSSPKVTTHVPATVLGIINGSSTNRSTQNPKSTELASRTTEGNTATARTALSISHTPNNNGEYGSLLAIHRTANPMFEPGSIEESESRLAGNAGNRSNDDSTETDIEKDSNTLADRVRRYFEIKERGSTIATEIRAGLVTFLTMSYITVINPAVLSECGIPLRQAAGSTAASAALATLIAGLLGNLPVGCAPGVGLSAYTVYGLAPLIDRQRTDSEGESITNYQIGFAIQFLSGLVVLVLTLVRLIPLIVSYIPEFLKLSTVVGMGVFLSFIGLLRCSIVIPGEPVSHSEESSPVLQLGDLNDWKVWLAMLNVLLMGSLHTHRVKGAMLLGILISTLIFWIVTSDWPSSVISSPKLADPASIIAAIPSIPVVPLLSAGLSFILIMIFDVSGVIFGIAEVANLMERDTHTGLTRPKGGIWPFIAVSVGTIAAALTGCSPIIVHAESLSGVFSGGRTGLTAVTIAVMFFLSCFFGPLFGAIPDPASAPTLILVGVFMMDQIQRIEWRDPSNGELIMTVALPSFVCVTMMPFTFSIASGMFFGIGSWVILSITGQDFFGAWRNRANNSAVSPNEEESQKNNKEMQSFSPVQV